MLTSLQNPLVKQMRKLHRSKERKEQQQFLLEGTHLLEESLAVNFPLTVVCCTPDWRSRHPVLWEQVTQGDWRTELVSPEVLQSMATTVHPDGVVAAAARVSAWRSPGSSIQLGVALATLQDPGNLGTVIRTAAAAGVDGLWLTADSVDLDHPKVLRASAGQWFRLPMAVTPNLRVTLSQFQSQGIQVVATAPTAKLTYWDVDLKKPTVILLGNEGAGLTNDLMSLADVQVKIPLALGVESLNVAIAAALLFYEAQRQRRSTADPAVEVRFE